MDFTIQGEFVGMVSTSPSKLQQIALQVRAAGKGGFEAAQYMGGLPGSGQLQVKALGDGRFETVKLSDSDAKPERVQLVGQRNDDFLVLSGGQWAMLVQGDQCLLIDREGNRVGRLERVHRQSPTLGVKPPEGAVVLFDGSNADQFDNARITDDGLLMEGADMKPLFQDFNMHLEFLLPFMPPGRDQGRGNSGVYLLSRYELQVLDSFALEPVHNGCGSLYQFRAPDVNMCFPPLVWQTYDIVFTAPRWAADGTKLKNARVTIWQNGTKIHDNVELPNKTGAGKPEDATLLPTRLQNHGDPVRFRNIWLIDRGAAPPTNFPIFSEEIAK